MPYITPSLRETCKSITNAIDDLKVFDVGTLTYLFYYAAKAFIRIHGRRYGNFAWVIGAFFCGAMEFYRRVIAKYEDGKRTENGDV